MIIRSPLIPSVAARRRSRNVAPSTERPISRAMAKSRLRIGSSRQLRNTTRAKSAVPRLRRLSAASARRSCATPAFRTELLPTPLGPYNSVSRDAIRLAAMILRSSSRPKKILGLFFGEGHQPRVGAFTHARQPPLAASAEAARAGRRCSARDRCRGCRRRGGPRTSDRGRSEPAGSPTTCK